jgi:transcription initiation factor IIE alpha subunit
MEAIFQQAKFDEKLDDKKRLGVFKEIRSRLEKNPLSSVHTCSRCGSRRLGISNIMEGTFACEICLAKDEINRRYK